MNLTRSGSWIVHDGYGTDRSPAGETSFDVNSLGLLYSLSVTF